MRNNHEHTTQTSGELEHYECFASTYIYVSLLSCSSASSLEATTILNVCVYFSYLKKIVLPHMYTL